MAPESALTSLAKGCCITHAPVAPSPFAERGHWGDDSRVLGPSTSHESHWSAPYFYFDRGLTGAEEEAAQLPSVFPKAYKVPLSLLEAHRSLAKEGSGFSPLSVVGASPPYRPASRAPTLKSLSQNEQVPHVSS